MKKIIIYCLSFLLLEIIVFSILAVGAVQKKQLATNTSISTTTTTTRESSSPVQEKTKESNSNNEEPLESTETEATTQEELPSNPIALTFDDGPNKETTRRLLDILKQREITASFFVLGSNIPGNENLLHRMKNEGHVIGSHSMHHQNFAQLPLDSVTEDMNQMDNYSKKLFGEPFKYMRPPYGSLNASVAETINKPFIQWSVDSKDWITKNSEKIVNEVTNSAYPGSIILLHDIYPETIEAVPMIIDSLIQKGYHFTTVDCLLDYPTEPFNYFGQNDFRAI